MGVTMIELDRLSFHGSALNRPECVVCTARGRVYAADWRGGIGIVEPDGSTRFLVARDPGFELKPNGIALMPGGSFLIAHLGAETGGVFRLDRDGALSPFLTELDGRPLPPTNFAHHDSLGRTWITVSTRLVPRALGYRRDVADGFVILKDAHGARIVADGLGYTNECLVDPSGEWLYVNETFARKLSRFRIARDGSLSGKEVVFAFGSGVFPDGLTFDAEGGVWITSVVSNRVLRLDRHGRLDMILEDSEAGHLAWVEEAFLAGKLGRPHLDTVKGLRLRNITSLAFGGPGLKTAYVGCLLGDQIASFPSPVAGWAPVHWDWDVD